MSHPLSAAIHQPYSNAGLDADCLGGKIAENIKPKFLPIQMPMPGNMRNDDGHMEVVDEESRPRRPTTVRQNTHPKWSRLDATRHGLQEPKASAVLHTRHILPEATNSRDHITEQADAEDDVSDIDNRDDEALDDGGKVRINISHSWNCRIHTLHAVLSPL